MLEYLIVNQLIQLVMALQLDAEIPQHDVKNYFLHCDALFHCPHMHLHRQSPPKKEKTEIPLKTLELDDYWFVFHSALLHFSPCFLNLFNISKNSFCNLTKISLQSILKSKQKNQNAIQNKFNVMTY